MYRSVNESKLDFAIKIPQWISNIIVKFTFTGRHLAAPCDVVVASVYAFNIRGSMKSISSVTGEIHTSPEELEMVEIVRQ